MVSSHIVAGTGLFSDMFAGLSDVLGGRSYTYQKQLNSIKKEVLDKLEKEAKIRGANAVLGVKIDFDEISGKGKTMFMVTAFGTAVRLEELRNNSDSEIIDAIFLGEDMYQLMEKNKIVKSIIQSSSKLTETGWSFIISNKVVEVLDALSDQFIKSFADSNPVEYHRQNKEYIAFKDYLISISSEENVEEIYMLLLKNHKHLSNLCLECIKETDNIDYSIINKVFIEKKLKPKNLPELMTVNPKVFKKDDINRIKIFIDYLETNYKKNSLTFEKKGLLSNKSTNYWECENYHKNSNEILYCETCHIDEYGYKSTEMNPQRAKDLLDQKIKILEDYYKDLRGN